ncbi:MAG: peptide chain release factor family protein [Candidatus Omnitrophota bacterium]
MSSFPVSSDKEAALRLEMERLGIRERDIEESFVRSGGPGGQNVNKVASCVVLRHLPSGLVVKCQNDRSQAMNRYFARRILLARIDALVRGRESAEAARIAKIRRQKRRRSRRAKAKMLDQKSAHGTKKRLRRPVREND